MPESIVVVGAKRTPIGAMQGKLNSLAAHQLGAVAIRAALEQAGVGPAEVDDLIMGCVLPAGQGQAPARQAALGAGLDKATPCTTINKMCGSGMKAAMMATAPSWWAARELNLPCRAPMGVRLAPTMTIDSDMRASFPLSP